MLGQCANIGEKDTLFKDWEPPKTIPYPAARTYIAHIGEYPPGISQGQKAAVVFATRDTEQEELEKRFE